MAGVIKRTDTFLESFAQVRDNKKVIAELGKKLARLQEDPLHVGGWLSGTLHGKKSTRIVKTIPAHIFPDEQEMIVYLVLIDHREHVYD